MTSKRNTQFIKGLEFFEYAMNSNLEEVLILEEIYKITFPPQLRQYLLHFQPIEMWDKTKYTDDVEFVRAEYFFKDAVNSNFNYFLPFYTVEKIIYKVRDHSDLDTDLFLSNMLLPICESVPGGVIVISMNNDSSFGKLFYIIDSNDFDATDNLFCNSLWEFLCGIEEVPHIKKSNKI